MSDQIPRLHRPWLAPAVALAISLAILAILLIPGVLRYRDAAAGTDDATWSEVNAALEEEIRRLAEAESQGVCMYDGHLYSREVEGGPLPPEFSDRLELLAPSPTRLIPDTAALPQNAAFDGNIDDLLRRSTVLILATQSDGFGNGTGFFIDESHVVTNAHVVEGVDTVIVTNDTIRDPLTATVVARTSHDPDAPMPQADFSLLRLSQPVPSALPLSLALARRTETIYASGYPGFFLESEIMAYYMATTQSQPAAPPEAVVTGGMVTTVQNVQRGDTELGFIPHTARISPGNSGGPLVDRCGRVVGINTYVTQSSQEDLLLHGDYALATPALAGFLQDHCI